MVRTSSAEVLLSGPRGRRLCWDAVALQSFVRTGRSELFVVAYDGNVDHVLSALEHDMAETDISLLASRTDIALLELVAKSVAAARYWQPPDEEDRALTDERVVHLLRPVAEAIARAPAPVGGVSDLV